MSVEMTDQEFAEHQLAASVYCEPTRELHSARQFVLRLASIAGVKPEAYVPGFTAEGNPEGLISIRAGAMARMAKAAIEKLKTPPAAPVPVKEVPVEAKAVEAAPEAPAERHDDLPAVAEDEHS